MNSFELIDIAFTARQQRKQFFSGGQHGRKSAMRGAHELPGKDSPTADIRTADVGDPDYCRICTPKGYGSCMCDIAAGE